MAHRNYRVVKTVVWDLQARDEEHAFDMARRGAKPDQESYEVIPQSDSIDLSACEPVRVEIVGIGIVRRGGQTGRGTYRN